MKPYRLHLATAVAIVAIVSISACRKEEPAAVATSKAPATMSVTSVDLGNAVGADMKVTTARTTFDPTETIIAAVSTATSDPAASVPGKLGVKWSYQDGNVVNDEAKQAKFTDGSTTDFRIANPAGFPVGKYKIEVSLDGRIVQGKEFEIK